MGPPEKKFIIMIDFFCFSFAAPALGIIKIKTLWDVGGQGFSFMIITTRV